MMTHDQAYYALREIDKQGEGITPWEIEFVAGFIDNKVSLFTHRQRAVIHRIYEERVKHKRREEEEHDEAD